MKPLSTANKMSQNNSNTQWQTLHHHYEKYEQYALFVKLFALAITLMCIISAQANSISLLLIGILWFQEGIWKTYQGRIGDVLIRLEHNKQDSASFFGKENSCANFPLYSQWQENRPNPIILACEYTQNALKPTVVYPYLPLMAIVLFS